MAKVPKQIYIITKSMEDYSGAENSSCALGAAFAQASHAKAMGRDVYLFLESNGINWAFKDYKPKVITNCFDPCEYFQHCLKDEIDISACQTCIGCSEMFCPIQSNEEDLKKLLYPGINVSTFTNLQCLMNEPCNIFTF